MFDFRVSLVILICIHKNNFQLFKQSILFNNYFRIQIQYYQKFLLKNLMINKLNVIILTKILFLDIIE